MCGITFEQGVLSTRMPQTPADAGLVADPYLLQIVKRPKQRAERKAIKVFKLVTPVDAVSLAQQSAARSGLCRARLGSLRVPAGTPAVLSVSACCADAAPLGSGPMRTSSCLHCRLVVLEP